MDVTGSVFGLIPVAGATVSFIDAESALASQSLQPVEDAAPNAKVRVTTDDEGRFTARVPKGSYFVYVVPSAGDVRHMAGGNLSRTSTEIAEGGVSDLEILLSERPPPDATYVGSSTCIGCHPQRTTLKGTLHFVGLRALLPEGPQVSSLQDLAGFPAANQGLTYYADGNPNDNTGATDDGYGYRFPTAQGYNVLLGLTDQGYFQAIESAEGLVSLKLFVVFTYGGEGIYKQRFITRLDADGRFTDQPALGSYYVLPAQYNETRGNPTFGEVTVPLWVEYYPEDWGPPLVDGARPDPTPAQARSFDNQCAGCHFTGMSLSRDADGLFQAHAVADPGGPMDYDGDGALDEMNIGCERCHGPGSRHIVGAGAYIIHPARLAPGRAGMICGQCHVRGNGTGTIDGEGQGMYASRNGPEANQMEFVRAGISPAEFFGTPDGTGILPDFGTSGGYYEPVDLAVDGNATWLDAAGGHGSAVDHSKDQAQQYFDHTRARHFQNPSRILACFDCHNPHEREFPDQTREPVDNNVLCLRCHAGSGDFTTITPDLVDGISGTAPQDPVIAAALAGHVTQRTFDLVDVSMNLNEALYRQPASNFALGRCVVCHMPATARSASWIVDGDGFVIRGDITSHTFDVVSPAISENMAGGGVDPVPNSCVPCHAGPAGIGAYPDYRYAK